MKKTIISIAAAAVCASVLSTSAFAEDITKDLSVFAENAEKITANIDSKKRDGVNTHLDPKSIMPVYEASIIDYISTGELNLSYSVDEAGNCSYYGDVIDDNGKFAGVACFSEHESSISVFYPEYAQDPITYEKHKQCSPIYFHQYSGEIKSLLLANGISTDVKEVKFLALDGVGSVYYINNGTDEVLVKTRGLERSPYPGYFEGENSDIIVLNEEFRQKAASIVEEERKAYEEFKNKYGEDAYAVGGAGNVGNPNTGDTGLAVASAGALAVCAVSITLLKKKKD